MATKAPKAKKTKTSKSEVKEGLDRKSLADKARQLKTELLAIRFNLQSPSLRDFRQKKQELQSLLKQLN